MKKRSFILGLVFLMFVSSVVYPNRVKDTEQSWEEEEDRSTGDDIWKKMRG